MLWSPDPVTPLVDTTGAMHSSDKHRIEILADQVQQTLRQRGVSDDNFFRAMEGPEDHSPIVSFDSSFTDNGSSVDNISSWEDSGSLYPGRLDLHFLLCGPNYGSNLVHTAEFTFNRVGNVVL